MKTKQTTQTAEEVYNEQMEDLYDILRPHQGHMPSAYVPTKNPITSGVFYHRDSFIMTASGVCEPLPRTFDEREEFLENMRVD